MTEAERFARLRTIFQTALDQPADTRRAWLAHACAGDADLLREAEALLDAHEAAGDFLDRSAEVELDDGETLAPGARLGDAYEIERLLGRGGMGVVYLARDLRLGRRVALKSLPASVAASPELQRRLRREARAAATISHPAVATVYALEEFDGHLYMATEYVPGHTLAAEIAQGPIAPARAGAMARQIAGALAGAHDAGVVHRDLKPDNVLIDAHGVKVVDFGIAHVEAPEATRLTRAGAMLGTPAYMAPEQLLGGSVDARADLFAFGVMLSEMLTGRHPLAEAADPRPRPPIPLGFVTIIARCLQADPAQRYGSARELMHVLEAVGVGYPLDAAGTTPFEIPAVADAGRTPTPQALTGPPSAMPRMPTAADGAASLPTGALDRSDAPSTAFATARWWWQFHQAAAAIVYAAMLYPAWLGRGIVGGTPGRAIFTAILAAVIVSATLRLHLWFTSRSYPEELAWTHGRHSRWLLAADWLFALTLVGAGLLVGDERSPLGVVLVSVGIGAAAAFLVVEPATTRAAFRGQ